MNEKLELILVDEDTLEIRGEYFKKIGEMNVKRYTSNSIQNYIIINEFYNAEGHLISKRIGNPREEAILAYGRPRDFLSMSPKKVGGAQIKC